MLVSHAALFQPMADWTSPLLTVTEPSASAVAAFAEEAKAMRGGDRGEGHEAEDSLAHAGWCLSMGREAASRRYNSSVARWFIDTMLTDLLTNR